MVDGKQYVYIIDDAASIRGALAALFRSVGLNVETFADANDFLTRADLKHCACIVLDIRLPGVTGLQLLERLNGDGNKVPVIVITAFADVPSVVRSFQNGAIDFFEKPVSDQAVLDCVQEAIRKESRRQNKENELEVHRARFRFLTERERDVMKLIVGGDSTSQIAAKLGLSEKTVEVHRSKIMAKTQAESLADLVRSAVLAGN
jgi:FixJ family two-component response regulator